MTGPVVRVTNTATASSAGSSQSTGTMFIVAKAGYGPEEPKLVKSLGEGVALYGPRSEAESQGLYDYLNTFFELGGQRAYINRTAGEGSPAAAKEELEAGAVAKTLVVTAKYKGTYGNKLKIEVVENEGKTKSKLVIYNPEGEALETSGEYAKASELFEWGKTHEAYVLITEGSGYSTGKGEIPKKLASKALAGGTNPTVNEKTTIKTLEGFPKSLGPGTLVAPGNSEEKVHTAMAELSLTSKGNRVAAPDLKEAEKANVTVATLTGEKGTYATGIAGNMIFCSSTAIVQGVTAGTTRTIPASVIVAALRARISATGNDNQAPCGPEWSLAPFVTGFTNTFRQEQIEELSTAGINSFKEVNGVPCLYGFVTALSKEKDVIYWQASATAERMALTFKGEAIGNTFLFKTIDGKRQLIHKFGAALQAMCLEQEQAGGLFGFAVNVEEPINTLTTIANGELNAELGVQMSPFANVVNIQITSVPATEVA